MKNRQNKSVFALILLLFFVVGCSKQMADISENGESPVFHETLSEQRCTPIFSPPVLRNKMCISEVTEDLTCDGNPQNVLVFVAVPIKTDCASLREQRDFFPQTIYGGDPDFEPILRSVAVLLRREAAKGSSEFLKLGKRASIELAMRQMASLGSMRLSSGAGFEYEFSFVLSDSKESILLSISDDGRKFNWARMVE